MLWCRLMVLQPLQLQCAGSVVLDPCTRLLVVHCNYEQPAAVQALLLLFQAGGGSTAGSGVSGLFLTGLLLYIKSEVGSDARQATLCGYA
jgi:hypothetical protein